MPSSWTPELSLNNAELDGQHAELFRLLEAAALAVEGGGAPGVERALTAFGDALLAHVGAEDAIMDESLYPERGRHKLAHELFVHDFLQMREELREKGPTPVVAQWVGTRIPEWLRFHIVVNDTPLGDWLAGRRGASKAAARGASKRLS